MAKRHTAAKKTAKKKTARKSPKKTAKKPARAKSAKRPKASKRKRSPPDPRALTIAQTARMLNIPAPTIRAHLKAGAPAGPDTRINLVHYAAWLNARIAWGASGDADG